MTSVLKDVTTGTWNYMSPECIRSGGSNFEGHKVRCHPIYIYIYHINEKYYLKKLIFI